MQVSVRLRRVQAMPQAHLDLLPFLKAFEELTTTDILLAQD